MACTGLTTEKPSTQWGSVTRPCVTGVRIYNSHPIRQRHQRLPNQVCTSQRVPSGTRMRRRYFFCSSSIPQRSSYTTTILLPHLQFPRSSQCCFDVSSAFPCVAPPRLTAGLRGSLRNSSPGCGVSHGLIFHGSNVVEAAGARGFEAIAYCG